MEKEEVNYYQPRFARWINSSKWDSIAEKLTYTQIDIITRVMNAERDGDISWLVWYHCDHILERIRALSKQIN